MWAMPQSTAGREVGRRADVLREVIEHLGHPRRRRRGLGSSPRRCSRAASRARRPAWTGSPRWSGRTCRGPSRSTARRSSAGRCRRAARRGRGTCDSPGWLAPPGANASSACGHPAGVGVQVERRAVGEERPPLRIERDQVELVLQVAAGLGEDPPQDRRHQQDGRPHVEAVTHPPRAPRPCRPARRSSRTARPRSPAPPGCRPRPGRRGRRRSRRSDPSSMHSSRLRSFTSRTRFAILSTSDLRDGLRDSAIEILSIAAPLRPRRPVWLARLPVASRDRLRR